MSRRDMGSKGVIDENKIDAGEVEATSDCKTLHRPRISLEVPPAAGT